MRFEVELYDGLAVGGISGPDSQYKSWWGFAAMNILPVVFWLSTPCSIVSG
jgi:hypothetical protein